MNLYKLNDIKAILKKYNLSPLKQLGQNFLHNEKVLNDIADSIEITKDDNVLEIGPGMGALTNVLAQKAKRVVSVEIDKGMVGVLKDILKDQSNVNIVHQDFLKIQEQDIYDFFDGEPFKVCANLPYYITTPIIMKLLESGLQYDKMSFLIQKEVAQRLSAKPNSKSYNSLSIAVEYYADVKIAFSVARGNFYPVPNVDSVVAVLSPHCKPVDVENEKQFFEFIRNCFNQRRKTLVNNILNSYSDIDKMQLEELLTALNINKSIRAEALNIQEFAAIFSEFKELNKIFVS